MKKRKIFIIGLNKTGTTSVGKALEDLGLNVAKQYHGEKLLDDFLDGRYDKIIRHCKVVTNEVFQDVPFSSRTLFPILDYCFPNSRFILTERSSAEEWYDSLVKFHCDMMKTSEAPTWKDLVEFSYIKPGWLGQTMVGLLGVDPKDPYDKTHLINQYNDHNELVKNYFRYREDLLVLNLSRSVDYGRMLAFLGLKSNVNGSFPTITSKDIVEGKYSCKFLRK